MIHLVVHREALKGWILERKEIITEWDDVNVRYVPQFKLKYCTLQ